MNNRPKTALLIIDVLNSFFDPQCGNYYERATNVLDPIHRLTEIARSKGGFIVNVAERHREGLKDFEHPKLPDHCIDGHMDAEYFPGFEPRIGSREIVITKRRYSSFFGTDLDLTLREQEIQRVMIVGVKTNVCIRATVQDAFAYGYEVVVPREATNSNRPNLEEAAVEDIDRYFGKIITLDEATGMLE